LNALVQVMKAYWLVMATAGGLTGGAVAYAVGAHGPAEAMWGATTVLTLGPVLYGMVRQVLERRAGVDVIAVLAMVGALALEEYLAGAVIAVMLATGGALETFAERRASRELTSLLQRAPRFALRVDDGELTSVSIEEVQPGDTLLVRDSDVVPVDGVVMGGPAVLNESALTGESRLVERQPGEMVSSGVVNAGAAFRMRAAATAEHSTYAGIIRLVRAAQEAKAPLVRLADRYALFFVPLTLAIAGAAWIFSGSAERALAVIVVATPCPLILAVPIAIVSGVSRTAKRGIVVKGGGAIEVLARVRAVYVDKTGTLTSGTPSLVRVTTFGSGHDEATLLRLGASLDQVSSHVMAASLVRAARQQGLSLAIPDDVREVPGAGVEGAVDGHRVRVGSIGWLRAPGELPDTVRRFRRSVEREGGSTVYIEVDGLLAGACVLQDPIRPEAPRAIRALKRAGVAEVVMVTGDHPGVADAVGSALGVDRVIAGCSPAEKVEAVRASSQRQVTVMVGDGINDAPALAAADVGVAMGARGATSSSEAADIVLMVDRLDRLPEAIQVARRTRRIAVQSVAIGMGLSLIAMGFAAFGYLRPVVGAFLQEAIDIVAILSALRALTGARDGRAPKPLPASVAEHLRREHLRLSPAIEQLRSLADRLEDLEPGEARAGLFTVNRFLLDEVLPHERHDEAVVYPQLAELLGSGESLVAMSRTHQEVFHLLRAFNSLVEDTPSSGPDREDLADIRRVLYALHVVLALNIAQEEELYLSLDDGYLGRGEGPREDAVVTAAALS